LQGRPLLAGPRYGTKPAGSPPWEFLAVRRKWDHWRKESLRRRICMSFHAEEMEGRQRYRSDLAQRGGGEDGRIKKPICVARSKGGPRGRVCPLRQQVADTGALGGWTAPFPGSRGVTDGMVPEFGPRYMSGIDFRVIGEIPPGAERWICGCEILDLRACRDSFVGVPGQSGSRWTAGEGRTWV